MRFLFAAVLLASSALSLSAGAADEVHELVWPTSCPAGGALKSTEGWRVQLGAFDDRAAAKRFVARAQSAGIPAAAYEDWSSSDDRILLVVVSASQPTRSAAARASARYRAFAPEAFVRRYRVWE